MQVYTYSEARHKLALLLEQAEHSGKVTIRRKDGRTFSLTPEKIASSPLDVPTIKAEITTKEIEPGTDLRPFTLDLPRAGQKPDPELLESHVTHSNFLFLPANSCRLQAMNS